MEDTVEPMPTFALEEWFRRFAFIPGMINLSPSNPLAPSLAELLDQAGLPRDVLGSVSLDYGETKGAPALREAIAKLYSSVSPDDIVVTAGALEAITLVLATIVKKGTPVVLETPIYGSYEPLLRRLGATVIAFELRAADGFGYDFSRLSELVRDSHAELLIANPFNNPTGRGIDSSAALAAVAELTTTAGVRIVCDEVFRPVNLDGDELASALDLLDDAIVLADMTKPYGLGGLRIGWVASRDTHLAEHVCNLRDYTTNSNATLSEKLAEIALSVRGSLLRPAIAVARDSRDVVESLLKESGGVLRWTRPSGGFCGFIEVACDTERPVAEICAEVALETHQLLLPGAVFGEAYSHYIRIGLAAGGKALREGLLTLLDRLS
jgi:aspartate/methionine/tyrosine aminotransferase